MFIHHLTASPVACSPARQSETVLLGHHTFGNGPHRVIVLHDWMGDAANYGAVVPWLDTERFTFVFADVRGYGKSRELTGTYSSSEVAGDVSSLADHLGWTDYSLVGHSMNGMSAFRHLLDDWTGPRRVRSLVAIAPVTPDGYPATAQDREFLAATITNDEMAHAAYGALTGGRLSPRWAARRVARHRKASRREAIEGYYDMWLGEDFSAEFAAAGVATPVLVIGGRNDLAGFQQAHYDQTLAHWLTNVSFEYIDNAGHYPMFETPILLASLIERHLESVERDGATTSLAGAPTA